MNPAWNYHVQTFRVVCHNTGAVGNNGLSDNHWTMYLLVGHGLSVQVNMRTDSEDVNGILDMTPRDYIISRSSLLFWDFPAQTTYSPRMLLDRLANMAFGDYTFTNGGIGCRYWILQVMYLLELGGVLQRSVTVRMHSQMPFYYSSVRGPSHRPIVQGTFDNVATQTLASNHWNQMMGQVSNQITMLENAGHSAEAQRSQLVAMQQSAAQGAALQASRSDEDSERTDEDSEGNDEDSEADDGENDDGDDDDEDESDGDE